MRISFSSYMQVSPSSVFFSFIFAWFFLLLAVVSLVVQGLFLDGMDGQQVMIFFVLLVLERMKWNGNGNSELEPK